MPLCSLYHNGILILIIIPAVLLVFNLDIYGMWCRLITTKVW